MDQARRSPVAMVSDFGLIDSYVGVMKGVILGIAPGVSIVDITHQMPPQNVAAARFTLGTAVKYFPEGTVFLAVVDPGVGTQRRAIALNVDNHYFVGPDNGIFSAILEHPSAIAAVALTNPNYWRTPAPRTTFHGRDIFAPAAAHLANGVPLQALGEAIAPETLTRLTPPKPQTTSNGWVGHIQSIDHFGNLITTIPGEWVTDASWFIQTEQDSIPGGQTYGVAQPGQLVALVGSHGWVEIAQNQGNGAIALGLTYGDQVHIITEKSGSSRFQTE